MFRVWTVYYRCVDREEKMRSVKLLVSILVLGLVVCGCNKGKPETEPAERTETTTKQESEKEAAMGLKLKWLGHASFRISHEDTVIYIDPWKLKDSPHDATLVLVSHSHGDHYSPDDIKKVSGPDTKLIASSDVILKEKTGEAIAPGMTIQMDNVQVTGVASYNPNKQFHPKEKNWVGFIIEVGSKRIYYAGDTDLTEEMKALKDIDLALLPVGGKYTMDGEEAAQATKHIKPKQAIPYHWGDIIGSESDAEEFAEKAEPSCKVEVLQPGETISF